MQEQIISKLGNRVIELFGRQADKISKQVKFTQRKDKSKLKARSFLKVLILGCLSQPSISLEQMCQLFKEEGIKISKQGLHQRFNTKAFSLVKGIYEEAIELFKTEQQAVIELLKHFSGVNILDSSVIGLPAGMKESYRGCGGGLDAALKIQTLFDYVDGQIKDITITEGYKNDQSFKEHLAKIEKGALYLQDLGYFDKNSFSKIHQQGAYFISRHFNQTALLDTAELRIDLAAELRESGPFFTKKAYLGKKDKVLTRIVAQRLSDVEVEKRVRQLRKKAQKKGETPRQETLELAKWSICITNVPEEILKDEHIYLLYSLRWQIELFFKLCKQEAGIDKIRGKRTERVLCELYAKLINVMMLLYLCFPVRWEDTCEISFPKAYQYLRRNASEFFKALRSLYRLKLFLKKFLSDIKEFAMKDRKRPATYQKLMQATGQEVLV